MTVDNLQNIYVWDSKCTQNTDQLSTLIYIEHFRKLSIGGESNNDRVSPPRLTRSFVPAASPTEERRRTLISDGTPVEKSQEQEPAKTAIGGWPVTKRDNLPALPVAKNRPIKTSVSYPLEHLCL